MYSVLLPEHFLFRKLCNIKHISQTIHFPHHSYNDSDSTSYFDDKDNSDAIVSHVEEMWKKNQLKHQQLPSRCYLYYRKQLQQNKIRESTLVLTTTTQSLKSRNKFPILLNQFRMTLLRNTLVLS